MINKRLIGYNPTLRKKEQRVIDRISVKEDLMSRVIPAYEKRMSKKNGYEVTVRQVFAIKKRKAGEIRKAVCKIRIKSAT